ncbi:acyltransferase [Rummeliibacillus sp. JY-2-4R]
MQNDGKLKIRDSNFELLRILSMFMIVILHIGTHGLSEYVDISHSFEEKNQFLYYFIRSMAIIAVSLYVLVSGYFLSKSTFKLKKLVSLFLEVSFFSTILYVVSVLVGNADFHVGMFIKSVLSVFTGEYWFVTVYFALYALSPFLNKLLSNLNKKEHGYLLITLFLISCVWQFTYDNQFVGVSNGYGLIYFIFLYFLAAYIQRYEFLLSDLKRSIYLSIYIIVALLNGYLVYQFGWADQLYSYNSPFVLIMSYCLFQFFKKIKIQSPKINFASKYVFGIYLIHEHFTIRPVIWKKLGIIEDIISSNGIVVIAKIIGYCIIVFISCWVLSFILSTMYKALSRKIIR